jgi:hypothetical protein
MKKVGILICLSFIIISAHSVMAQDLKALKPAPGKTMVYFLRPSNFGGGMKIEVTVDGKELGVTKMNTFLYSEMVPGKHVLETNGENNQKLDVDLKSDSTYYYNLRIYPGFWKGRCELDRITEAKFTEWIVECKPGKMEK